MLRGRGSGSRIGTGEHLAALAATDPTSDQDAWVAFHVLLYRLADRFGASILTLPFDQVMLLAQIMAEDSRQQAAQSSSSTPPPHRRG